ncbi:DNA-processing protein DprA [Paenibacillus senegalensis]|uniref:DNA-processing protein DprA n=1 Tax=Paenibacillus senegalensis TaxID=1465766 RepID=UPI0002886F42|nr:DNA-processing protein DprA [Paenibacillus senegalensis]
MDIRQIVIALNETKGVGWRTINQLESYLGEAAQLAAADIPSFLAQRLPPKQAAIVKEELQLGAALEKRLESYRRMQIRIVTKWDEAYPEQLKQSSRPPWVLYAMGRSELLNCMSIAIVGTRTPTAYGKKAAATIAEDLARLGIAVISGLARGIDSSAHAAALPHPGGTIAVLGHSMEYVYPGENKVLFQQIAREGLLISEFPLGTPPHPGLFPQRNRIIASLSLGTLVVEAALKSGSLITADLALEESRDVFAVPGPISSPKSAGTHALIQQGAKLVTSFRDILDEYSERLNFPSLAVGSSSEADSSLQQNVLSDEERRILNLISVEPVTVDELYQKAETNFGHLHTILLSLLMKKKIVQIAGSSYVLS